MASFIDIQDILNDYSEAVSDGIADELIRVAKEGKAEIKNVSPKRGMNKYATGKYANGWTIKTTRKKGKTEAKIWNAKHYRLTHLLEKEHAGKNQYGQWGTVYPKSIGHISKVQNQVNEELQRAVDNVIKNGG